MMLIFTRAFAASIREKFIKKFIFKIKIAVCLDCVIRTVTTNFSKIVEYILRLLAEKNNVFSPNFLEPIYYGWRNLYRKTNKS